MSEDIYWKKYAERFKTFPRLVEEEINPDVSLIICIPVCCETKILDTLISLTGCEHSEISIEIILLFNKNSYMTSDEIIAHDQSWDQCSDWVKSEKYKWMQVLPVYVENMPDPKGGVGWARKLCMDEAARRLSKEGLMLCLDADCTVSTNYLEEIINQFHSHPGYEAASIYFEHPLGNLDVKEHNAIVQYELHLRYLVHAQRWSGHPFAYQTVGSSMAVRRNAYLSQGGMNTKRAGEDFYFLQKFIETGKLFEIRGVTVYPSSRISNRVPFGTGKAMNQIMNTNEWFTINFEIFALIKPLFDSLETLTRANGAAVTSQIILEQLLDLNESLILFLSEIGFQKTIEEILLQTNSNVAFAKRFFRYFNSFQMIRYMHYMRDISFPNVQIEEAMLQLFLKNGYKGNTPLNVLEYLLIMREMDMREPALSSDIPFISG